MDRIIALYRSQESAERARVRLHKEGFATDRLDVISSQSKGRAVDFPGQSRDEDLFAHFRVLLDDEREGPLVDGIVDSIRNGKAVLVVLPRGEVEIEQARDIIEAHEPETVFWRVAPPEAQGGLLGEHAAGFRDKDGVKVQ